MASTAADDGAEDWGNATVGGTGDVQVGNEGMGVHKSATTTNGMDVDEN